MGSYLEKGSMKAGELQNINCQLLAEIHEVATENELHQLMEGLSVMQRGIKNRLAQENRDKELQNQAMAQRPETFGYYPGGQKH